MGNNNMLLIFRSLCLNYPIMKSWGYEQKQEISLVFWESSQMVDFIKVLSPNRTIIQNQSISECRSKLKDANGEAVVYVMPRNSEYVGAKTKERIETIREAECYGTIDEHEVNALIFRAYIGFVNSDTDSMCEIHVSGEFETEMDFYNLIPSTEQLAIIKDRVSSKNLKLSLFELAVEFCYPKLKEMGEEEKYKILMERAKSFASEMKINKDKQGNLDYIVEFLSRYFEELPSCKLCRLPYVDDDPMSSKNIVYVNERFLYFSENEFRTIVTPLLEEISFKQIKTLLRDAGIICADSDGYTTKMNYVFGTKIGRLRMMKLAADKIQITAGNSLAEYIDTCIV